MHKLIEQLFPCSSRYRNGECFYWRARKSCNLWMFWVVKWWCELRTILPWTFVNDVYIIKEETRQSRVTCGRNSETWNRNPAVTRRLFKGVHGNKTQQFENFKTRPNDDINIHFCENKAGTKRVSSTTTPAQ